MAEVKLSRPPTPWRLDVVVPRKMLMPGFRSWFRTQSDLYFSSTFLFSFEARLAAPGRGSGREATLWLIERGG